eukprot:3820404-Karenia_brevis.AAC.1
MRFLGRPARCGNRSWPCDTLSTTLISMLAKHQGWMLSPLALFALMCTASIAFNVINFRRPLIMPRICAPQGEKCHCLLLCVPM